MCRINSKEGYDVLSPAPSFLLAVELVNVWLKNDRELPLDVIVDLPEKKPLAVRREIIRTVKPRN